MRDDDRLDLFGSDDPEEHSADSGATATGARRAAPDPDQPGPDGAAAPDRASAAPRRGVAEDEEVEEDDRKAGAAARRSRRAPKVFLAVVMAIIVLLAAILGYYLKSISDGLGRIDRQPLVVEGERPSPAADHKPLTFVLVGSDSRGWDRGRSDTLMVAYLPADRKNLYLISFLRDMWVTIPANPVVDHPSQAKINAAYSWGGMPLTVKVLEGLTGVRMDHAAVIDFKGFVKLTDALGGVQVYNDQAFTQDGHHFETGNITLRGARALAYVQNRKSLARGDIDRAAHERAVLTAIIHKTLTADVLTNPAKFREVVTLAGETMTVDDGLSNAEIRKIATSLRFSSGDAVVQVQAPIKGFATSSDGQQYDVVDAEGLKELSEAMRTDTMADYVRRHPQ